MGFRALAAEVALLDVLLGVVPGAGMTKRLALAHAAEGIRVNCVCPGCVETDMWTMVSRNRGKLVGMTAEEFTRQRAAQVPLNRMETPEDVPHVVAFLAGPRSSYMTGQALSVDGGLVMH